MISAVHSCDPCRLARRERALGCQAVGKGRAATWSAAAPESPISSARASIAGLIAMPWLSPQSRKQGRAIMTRPSEAGQIRRILRFQNRASEKVPRSRSAAIRPVIREPEITKKTSTPTYPPAMPQPAWQRITAITAIARRPSMSARYPSVGSARRQPGQPAIVIRPRPPAYPSADPSACPSAGAVTAAGSAAGSTVATPLKVSCFLPATSMQSTWMRSLPLNSPLSSSSETGSSM